MKELIKAALKDCPDLPNPSEVIGINSVSGGCIHEAWRIELGNGHHLFAKTNDIENFNMLEYEFDCLLELRDFVTKSFISIPKPLHLQKTNKSAILLLQWLEITTGQQTNLGKGLALLHLASAKQQIDKFGWGNDGFIGSTPQVKGWESSWGECFVNLRLIPQLKLASKWGFELHEYEKLLSFLKVFLNKHQPESCLLHGDLWSGNCGVSSNGSGLLFDPACYWGDREVDLAMTKLFGGFTNDFYQGYQQTWPISKTANERMSIYNLYHLLNHANMFGGSYKQQSIQEIKKIRLNLLN